MKFKTQYSSSIKILRYLDVAVAIASYLYMSYFVYKYCEQYKNVLYLLLITTIAIYILGKTKFGIKKNIHTYFHIAIGLVSSIIVILK